MSNKHNAIVELLLDNENIDVNCRDNQGNTPLHAAVEVGDIADGDVDDDAFFMTITGHQYHPRQQGGQRLWCEPATEAQEHGHWPVSTSGGATIEQIVKLLELFRAGLFPFVGRKFREKVFFGR